MSIYPANTFPLFNENMLRAYTNSTCVFMNPREDKMVFLESPVANVVKGQLLTILTAQAGALSEPSEDLKAQANTTFDEQSYQQCEEGKIVFMFATEQEMLNDSLSHLTEPFLETTRAFYETALGNNEIAVTMFMFNRSMTARLNPTPFWDDDLSDAHKFGDDFDKQVDLYYTAFPQ